MLTYKQFKNDYAFGNKKIIYFINILLITAKLGSFLETDTHNMKNQVKKKL